MPSSNSYTPYFVPRCPPPQLPLLLVQTDLSYSVLRLPKVTAQEKLLPRADPVPGGEGAQDVVQHPPLLVNCRRPTPAGHRVSSVLSDLSDEEGFIPKPQGEAGRPSRGGYNLQHTLNWNPGTYEKLKDYVSKLVIEHLDVNQPLSDQNEGLLQVVRDAAVEKYPELLKYRSQWPVTDLIRMGLKNKSAAQKRAVKIAVQKNTKP